MIRKNKIIIILISIVVIVGAFLIFYNIQNKSSQPPTISISEEEWDFGKIKEDERPVHIFNIKNIGKEELIISRVRASCGCTATMLSSDNIKPGQLAELQITFNPTGFNGIVKKDIHIESNDPQLPTTKVTIIAEVEPIPSPQAFFSDSQWDLGLISQGDFPAFTFTIENKGELDLIIDKVDASEYIQYDTEIPLTILPGEKQEVIFTYNSSQHELGEVRESIRIYCNDPRRKALSLRIDGYIKEKPAPTVSISPVGASFNLITNSEDETIGRFVLVNSGEEGIKITSIETSADYLVPLASEIELNSGEKENLQVILLKDRIPDKIQEEEIKEYLYLTVAIPIVINR
ncbi:hypothetical protein A2V47_08980 [Candidatus Atribacteria bacterium RBG_19FT_COMBO_35_14]|uniref:Abnormal spindle-like microcephaly-associated protein ASH domain-containing protein n=1 Tax=Candidatus Sediminicultor quintus TaxID=1797291 RepID=A0A1F5AAF7_9BACT|nr:MAG: hypothetical protein A2V47_08980 [Candidatus Atribacteria bacterium RBG_19FT_COMBO_35_14]OGD36346.1 MAG: hypothetical protein A2V94_02740 [Candidatus Atribacteria bacterium RBG_16_35_8]